jgi:hypothetical protein
LSIAAATVLAPASFCLALPNEPGPTHASATNHAHPEGTSCIVKTDIPRLDRALQHTIERIPAPVTLLDTDGSESPFADRGAANNRVNIVIVGDGYLASQQATFHTHTTNTLNSFFSYEPFKTYKNYFQPFRVEVVSTVSGVSGDPTSNITKNTPLQMRYWCSNVERLLCVNVSRAYQYAANSPQPFDQILAIANSTKYGGAGYPGNEIGTLAGGHGSAPLIAIHEMGHSLGDLEDEYDYGGSAVYQGGEPSGANASVLTSGSMASAQTKWWRWLNDATPGFDGPISTYEGAVYSVSGVYRPSPNSMMRALGPQFNLPSCEALLVSIYDIVRPIDGPPSPATSVVLNPASSVSITTMQKIGNPLTVQWVLDGQAIPGATGSNFNVASINLRNGASSLAVRVVDETNMVRDPVIRNSLLTQTLTWSLPVAPCLADLTGDRIVDDADFPSFALQYDILGCAEPAMPQFCSADFNGDGFVDDADFVIFANLYNALNCP